MLAGEVDPRSRMQRSSPDSQRRDNSPKPLERRVNFCEPCAGMVSGPDEPRKSFMKVCETDDILTSDPLKLNLLRVGPVNINLALQKSAFLDGDALGRDIS